LLNNKIKKKIIKVQKEGKNVVFEEGGIDEVEAVSAEPATKTLGVRVQKVEEDELPEIKDKRQNKCNKLEYYNGDCSARRRYLYAYFVYITVNICYWLKLTSYSLTLVYLPLS